MTRSPRVRLAPSPTGDPHVGTAYIALFNYAFAKKNDGRLILRIEDTDQSRRRSSSEGLIIDSLRWLGLDWDEGPDIGGSTGPYRQSERIDIYQSHTQRLIDGGHAYRCFCTPERLTRMREDQKTKGLTTRYDRRCLQLSPTEIEKSLNAKTPYVVRLKMPTDGKTVVQDHLRGEVAFDNERIDDQVLLKSDGFPTYHLAVVVDDHLMKITHVIRGEEWINSTPKHIQLYKAFGWEEPVWVHLPLLRNTDKSKLSKRKNPTSITFFRRSGILPEALRNFLAMMGWNFGDDVEIFDLASMIERFQLEDINLGGPVFDQKKLNWMNQQYMQKLTTTDFVKHLRDGLFSADYIAALRPLVIERIERFDQFIDKNAFFFNGALDYTRVDLIPKAHNEKETRHMLKSLSEHLDAIDEWNVESLKACLDFHKNELGWKPRDYFMTIRLVTTGRKDSPPLLETLAILGKDITSFRVRDGWKALRESGPPG